MILFLHLSVIHATYLLETCLLFVCVSLRKSIKANKATPTGDWNEKSTVFVDVEHMELEGSSVRVYDCAGQVTSVVHAETFIMGAWRSGCVRPSPRSIRCPP